MHACIYGKCCVCSTGKLLLECAACVPDGIVAFFTSYSYMQQACILSI